MAVQTTQITEDNIRNIFDAAQDSSACHLRYSLVLKEALECQDQGALLDKFMDYLRIILTQDYKQKNIYMDRLIKFVVTFCNCLKVKDENDEIIDHLILTRIITFLSTFSRYKHDPCRYWSCKIIREFIENTDDLSEELFEQIKESLLERFRDSKSAIRLEALKALYRFQDPLDKEDAVIPNIHEIMGSDFNATVRQICVEKIALTKQTIPSLLDRIRDVDVNVRLTAFKRIAPIPKYLIISQKRLVLQCGFLDSSDKIRNYVATVLLEDWLSNYENDYFLLMKSVRFDACKEDIKKTTFLVERILNSLFKNKFVQDIASKVKLNELKLMDFDDLNWESVSYYRLAVQYLRTSDCFEEALNSILPELVVFCQYIKQYIQYMKSKQEDHLLYHFILEQLFTITLGYDVSDEASRKSLNSLLHFMLQNTVLDMDVATVIVQNLEKTIPNFTNRSIFICEIISNIMYGEDAIDYEELNKREVERQHQISEVKSDIMSLHDEELECVSQKRFLEADEIQAKIKSKQELLDSLQMFQEKPEIGERKTDVLTVTRYLTIAEAFLRSPLVKELNAALVTLCSDNIQKNLVHKSLAVRTQALRCYALCCIVDLKSAKYGIHIFSAPIFSRDLIDSDGIETLIVSIKAVVDLLRMYGLNLVEKSDEENVSESEDEEERKVFIGGTSLADLIKGLADLLEHENSEVQEVTTTGICMLLVHNSITSPSLLSRIIIKWANPATDNDRVKQFIGHTLHLIPSRSNCLAYFSDVVILTLRTLVYAPSSSPLQDVNIEYIAKFMINLCQMSSQGSDIHTDIALKMCTQMNDKPKAKVCFIYSKVLLLLDIPKNQHDLNELLQMSDELRDRISNNQISKNIIKFNAKLQEILNSVLNN